jgi:hypothetical protein
MPGSTDHTLLGWSSVEEPGRLPVEKLEEIKNKNKNKISFIARFFVVVLYLHKKLTWANLKT